MDTLVFLVFPDETIPTLRNKALVFLVDWEISKKYPRTSSAEIEVPFVVIFLEVELVFIIMTPFFKLVWRISLLSSIYVSFYKISCKSKKSSVRCVKINYFRLFLDPQLLKQ